MKRCFSLSRLVGLSLAFLVLQSGCGGRDDEPAAAPQYENPVLFYLKTPAPRVIASKTLDLTRRTENGAQTGMLLTFLLSGYGFPAFEDFDPEMPVGLFYFGSDTLESENAVLVTKARPDAKLLAEMAPQYDLTIEVFQDWLLLARSPEILAQIVSRDELLRLTEQAPAYDFEVTVLSRGLIDVKEQIIEKALADLGEEQEQEKIWAEAGLEVFFKELASTDRFVAGLSIGDLELSAGLDLHSFAGSELGKLITAPTAGRPDMGRHLRGGQSVNYVADIPARAMQAYLNHLGDSLASGLPATWQPGVRQIQTLANRNFDEWNGMSASTFLFHGELPQTIQLHAGNYRIENLRNLYDAVNALWFEHGPDPEQPLIYLFENEGEIDGLPYHRVEIVVDHETGVAEDDEDLTTSLFLVFTKFGMLQADTLEALTGALRDLQLPLAVADSLLPEYSATPDHWLQGKVYLERYFNEISADAGDTASAGPRTKVIEAIRALEGQSLEPLSYEISVEGYRLSWRGSLPLSTIEAIMKKM